MSDHDRAGGSLFFGERQKLRGKFPQSVAIKRYKIRDPEAVKDGEKQQRILWSISQRLARSINRARLIESRLGFGRCITFDMHQRRYASAT